MSEDPFEPVASGAAPPRVWNDKGDLRVPGAGNLGMVILLVSLSVIFAASMLLFVVFRWVKLGSHPWHDATIMTLPRSLWVSTAVIAVSSISVQMALGAIRRDDENGLRKGLGITLGLGVVFLALQVMNWWEVYAQLAARQGAHSFYAAFFYFLTALHAAHVVGGIIPMGITLAKAGHGAYSRNFHPGVRYCVQYWHFLAVVWGVLFVMIYVI